MFRVVLFCLFNIIVLANCSAVPFITKCKAEDSKCIKRSGQAALKTFASGIPELGVDTLDPFTLTETIDASTSGLKLHLKDMTVTGLKDCVVKRLYRDVENSKLGGKLLCDVGTTGEYEMDGKLLIINVKGQGKITVFLKKLLLTVDAEMGEKVGKDGVKYWDVKRFSHSFELQDKSELHFENLFTGNDVLGRATNDVISSSSNEIITEIGPPVIKAITVKVVENIRRFFNHVPPSDLSLD